MVKPDYEKCLPKTAIESVVGEGPIYDITIDPYQLEDCNYDNSYYNGYNSYNGEYCEFKDGKIVEEVLDQIVNEGQAIIEYDLGVEPNFLSEAIGDEVIWISPALVDKNYEKEYDVSYDYSNLPPNPLDIFDPDYICCSSVNVMDPNKKRILDIIDPDYTSPCDCCPRPRPGQRPEAIRPKHNVVDSQLSKDGKHYVFAYKNLYSEEIIVEVHDRTQESWAYLTKIKTGLTGFGALTVNKDATIIAVSDHKDSTVYENAGRIKIYQYDSKDKEYVRIDQIGFDTTIARSFTPEYFDFIYEEDIRAPRNFIIQRADDEVFILGTFPESLTNAFAQIQEDLVDVDRIFNTTHEDDFFDFERLTTSTRYDNYVALLNDKTVRAWGSITLPVGIANAINGKVSDIASTEKAFAALTEDGNVECWGETEKYSWRENFFEGYIDVTDQLNNITKIYSNSDAFAALKANGEVVTFTKRFRLDDLRESYKLGGSPYIWDEESSSPKSQVNLTNIDRIVGGNRSFAAITNYIDSIKGNTIVTWGSSTFGGDLDENRFGPIIGIDKLYSNRTGFASISNNKKVATWGSNKDNGDVISLQSNDQDGFYVHPSNNDNSTILYDQSQYVQGKLLSINATKIVSTLYAFAALSEDGQVVTWGNPNAGGLSFLRDEDSIPQPYDFEYYFPEVKKLDLESDLSGTSDIYATAAAFLALKTDGTVVTWGHNKYGAVSPEGLSSISQVFSTVGAFATINGNGGVVAWGDKNYGGDITFNNTDPTVDLTSGVTKIYATRSGFLAFKNDGKVVGWGDESNFEGINNLNFRGLIGRTKNFGLGYSLSLNDRGDILTCGNDKKTFVSTAFAVGSIRSYKRDPETLKWKRYGQEIKTSVGYKNAIGRMVKTDSIGNRIAAYEIYKTGNEYKSRINIFNYILGSWTSDHRINIFDHDKSFSPFTHDAENVRIPHSLDISSDGKTVAFGSVKPSDDSLNGKVVVIKYDEEKETFSNSGIINPDPIIGTDENGVNSDWNPTRLFGENVSLSHDGNNILVSSRESASIYEYGLILDYSISNDWQKKSQVFSYDNPKIKTFYQASDDNNSYGRIISAHMSSGADFVSTTHFDNSISQHKQYGHYIYKVDLEKDIDRFDYDHSNNYLSYFNATIQDSGSYAQLLFTKDSSIQNTTSNLRKSQGIGLQRRPNTQKSTYAFWSDVKLRSQPVEVIKVGLHKISLKVISKNFDRRRQIQVIFDNGNAYKTFNGSLISASQYDELFHFTVTVDAENKKVDFYEGSKLLGTYTNDNISFTENNIISYIGGFSSNTSSDTIILDDVRVFSRILNRDEIFKLANHRKLAYRTDTYYYDVVQAKCNDFRLEFVSGTYLDIPIGEFCTDFIDRNDCGKVIDSGCLLDAKIKFCYYTGAPHVTYVKSFGRPRDNDVPYSKILDPETFLTLSSGCELVKEMDEPLNVYASNFFIVGAVEEPPPFDDQVLSASGNIIPKEVLIHSLKNNLQGSGIISPWTSMDLALAVSELEENVLSVSSKWIEKFNGDFDTWDAAQVLYPSKDISSDGFVNKLKETENLFDSINEGVFTGRSYVSDNYESISDDSTSYITASSINTEFEANYKFEFTDMLISPSQNRLRIKMSGPLFNYESELPPKFHFSDIKLEDPDGGLICEYEDFTFIGDSNQYIDDANFVTYSLKPSLNYAKRYQWQDNYPNLYEASGHTLTFNVVSEDVGRPYGYSSFNDGFYGDNDFGPLDEEYQTFFDASGLNPSLRITAIELYASGRKIPYKEHYLNTYMLGQPYGGRIERVIKPVGFLLSDFDTGVRPAASSIWQSYDGEYDNTSVTGAKELLTNIRESNYDKYITTNNDAAGSGKLILQFGHQAGDTFYEVKPNSFLQSSFSNKFSRWFDEDEGVFNAKDKIIDHQDGFFLVEDIKLRILAKKNSDAEDYVIDVVGYSDDCLIHITPAMGGFLQNTPDQDVVDYSTDSIITYSPEGTVPTDSGFADIDDLGIATEPMSTKDQYYEDNTSNNLGGDHDLLSTYPVVTGTEFKWYEVPLRIYKDDVEIGRIKDYAQSTYLEKLNFDIYPIPSGASIAAIELAVRYSPHAALEMVVEGGEYRKLQDGRSEGSFYPVARQKAADSIFNAGSGYGPLSLIEDLPHAFSSPDTIKTNYSRRWRGKNGLVHHPFDMREFDRGFEENRIETSLLDAHADFSLMTDEGGTIEVKSKINSRNLVGVFTKNGAAGTLPDTIRNIGLRFDNESFFEDYLPGYSSSYKTADWTSLANGGTNFQSNVLYGQIFDGYDTAIRVGRQDNLLYQDVNVSSGACFFTRFIPDANMSGVEGNLYDFSTLFSTTATPSLTGLMVGFSGGYLFASGNNQVVKDTAHFSEYQYPLSVLVTYSENSDRKIRLYTDNELKDAELLRGESDPVTLSSIHSNLNFGYGGSAISGANMILCEAGFSTTYDTDMLHITSGCNILSSGAQLTFNQISVKQFFDNQRVKFFEPDESYENDDFELWSYVDENTYKDWYLGAFRVCEFNFEYDCLNSSKGKRTGRDYINFTLDYDGSSYLSHSTIDTPSTVNSGVAYHTQLENDFVRFYLSDEDSNFYSTHRRVSKSLPRGYDFAERALVVESIIDHMSSGDIVWEDGNIGPKLIVSLYTKNQEPYYTTDEPNWGLVNRHYHYLQPSSCLIRLDSTFTYGDYCDKSEEWALFPHERRLSEFTEKYYSKDINDMIVQYDIAYPSGSAFNSKLDIHTTHVRAEDAWVKATSDVAEFNLSTSGNIVELNKFDLHVFGVSGSSSVTNFPLHVSGYLPVETSGDFILCVSGNYVGKQDLNLYTINFETIDNGNGNVVTSLPPYADFVVGDHDPSQFGFFLVTQGAAPPVITTLNNLSGTGGSGLGMFIDGLGYTSGIFPLSIANNEISRSRDGTLNLSAFASSGAISTQSSLPIFMLQNYQESKPSNFGDASGTFGLSMIGSAVNDNLRFTYLDLFMQSYYPLENSGLMNLFLDGPPDPITKSGILELLVQNNNLRTVSNVPGQPLVYWANDKYGQPIEITDNIYSAFEANDEIRGVDLYGYGSCEGDSPDKAFDQALIVDDVTYRPKTCNEGGIFRATATYTNEEAGYQDNYYGIRKYSGLQAGRPYLLNLKITTGSTDPIALPNEWEEWEYGACGPGTIGDQDQQTLNFSGVKFIGDYPYLSGDSNLIDVSGRQAGDNYGKTVKVKNDLMAVGAPKHNINDETGYFLEDAGAIFLYRRNEEVAGRKAAWELEEKLALPLGARRDFVSRKTGTLINFGDFSIAGQQWEIGQEGRELGHSLDICQSGEREVVVAGGPGGAWSRTFPSVVTSGVPVFMVVFADQFTYSKTKIQNIIRTARKYDILYKYFSAPWGVDPDIWHPELDIKLLICEIYTADKIDELTPPPNTREPWFNHMFLQSVLDDEVDQNEAINYGTSGVIDKFKEIFPYKNAIHSGIPPIVGVVGDFSWSTNFSAAYKPVLDGFLDFYSEYSLQSGVYNAVTNTASEGYVNQIFDDSFNWDESSVKIMNETLDTGNLISVGALDFITSGVGQEWARDDSVEFQSPPESGGRVYIFEKEFGEWNLVQDIISPEEEDLNGSYDQDDFLIGYGNEKPMDRFGHSVSISDNSEIISVGSPYINEACQIYERDDEENARMYTVVYDWLVKNHDPYTKDLQSHIDLYNEVKAVSGVEEARLRTYQDLSKLDKFLMRKNKDIKLYRKVFNYDYTDIVYTGTWGVIPNEFAGTSRLGYSTAVDEQGNIVAFGAPTDSFNEFDDFNVWYGGLRNRTNYPYNNTWASYTNAGAVRVFESRKLFKHNKVVEFYKFGNLDRSVHQDQGNLSYQYNNLGTFFNVDGIDFERTQFEDIEIPKDAGLAFIITPEIDAASDEIIDNIKSWLALGDRTLVLVGNDPVWEERGLYEKSNNILNKILQKLGCRMRIVPARNRSESLAAGVTEQGVIDLKYNTIPARLPKYLHSTHVRRGNVFASGVADIKIDLSDIGKEDFFVYHPCDPDNFDRCGLPLKHMGDIRAGWDAVCAPKVEYQENWAFHFDSPNPAQGCDLYPVSPKPQLVVPFGEITPVIAAAEYKSQDPIIIEASSGTEEVCTTERVGTRIETITTGSTLYEFGNETVGEPAFIIQDTEDGLSGIYNAINSVTSEIKDGFFYNPEKVNLRNGIIQARGTSFYGEPNKAKRKVEDLSVYVAEEIFTDNDTNKLYMIASMLPQGAWSMSDKQGDQYDPRNQDQNIAFYNNLVMENCSAKANIYQLGDWTGRSSLKDAFSDSVVESVLKRNGHTFVNNATKIPSVCNVLWIVDPLNEPTAEGITEIKDWLSEGNKKIIISYGRTQKSADNVAKLCEAIGIGTKPYFVNGDDNNYYIQDTSIIRDSNLSDCCPITEDEENRLQLLDDSNIAISGCAEYLWPGSAKSLNSKVDKLSAIPDTADPLTLDDSEVDPRDGDGYNGYAYIPIKLGASGTPVVTFRDPIYENFTENPDLFWKIETKESTIEFPVVENSGYRLFAEWISETDDEKYDIQMTVDTATVKFSPEPGEESSPLDYASKYLDKTPKYSKKKVSWDIRVKEGYDSVTVKFDTKQWHPPRISNEGQGTPLTPRVLAVSGYLIPINSEYVETTRTKSYPIFETTCKDVPWYSPERVIEQPDIFRAISTNHMKYCNPESEFCSEYDPNLDVEDGPLIVADELEHFTSFDQGMSRSRIVLITDSTIIQGQAMHYRYDANSENGLFIRSLYPTSPEKQLYQSNEEFSISPKGRRFEFTQKLRAPEKGSPAKYYAASGMYNLVERYGYNGVAGNLEQYTDQEDTFALRNVTRLESPKTPAKIEQAIEFFGEDVIPDFGVYPRFSGMYGEATDTYDPKYVDAGIRGGVSRYMEERGYDYLDFVVMNSGYPGDLFGLSIDLYKDKLIVGAPFNGFNDEDVVSWSGVTTAYNESNEASGLKLGKNGGGGAAFYYERTGRGVNAVSEFLPWEFKQKIKPTDSIGVGNDNTESGSFPDRFGFSVGINSDFMAVGSPCHDYETLHHHIYSGISAFLRKEFNSEFTIPAHKSYDLGVSGIRVDDFDNLSGTMILNNGAVYTFRHKVTDFEDQPKAWTFVEKKNAQGYLDRTEATPTSSGADGDFFGYSVALDRPLRTDGDYIIVAGAPEHIFATSGDHATAAVSGAGSAYTFDAMLREQPASIPNPGSYIKATVFGLDGETESRKELSHSLYQNVTGKSYSSTVSGIVYANLKGEIFLEVSGVDPASQGFVSHRPYVESVIGEAVGGTEESSRMGLKTIGKEPEESAVLPVNILGADSAFVYNNIDLYTFNAGISEVGSGTDPFNLYTSGVEINSSGTLSLFTSGIGISEIGSGTTPLGLRIRGK